MGPTPPTPPATATYAPRDQATLDQIKALVQSAIGFDQTRGDQITIANLQFAQGPTPTALGTSAPGLFDFTRDDLINGAEMLVTLIIALALVFFVMRPLLKRVLAPEMQPLALPVSAEIGNAGHGRGRRQHRCHDTPAGPWRSPKNRPPPRTFRPGSTRPAHGRARRPQTLKTVGNLVQENPKQAALIVRDWLSSAV